MATTLEHRGPDGVGYWHHDELHFAHRRLAIVDVSPTGQQPMRSESGRFTISFNGEVYNFRRLRAELEQLGKAPKWRGSSDTEVMLAALECWGLEASLRRFIGMFAFALWDERERTLHLVRDRLGVKPLYWCQTAAGLAFGSELRALRRFPGFDSSISGPALAGFVQFNCVVGNQSIHAGTQRVMPGTVLSFRSPELAPVETAYWRAADIARTGLSSPFEGTEDDARDELEALLSDSVALRMVADVPLGAFLSGGLDSATVVAMMQRQSERPVHTFSISNESAAWDEGPAAARIAKHLGTVHTPLMVRAQDALDLIPRLGSMFDEPFSDSSQIPTYLVSKLARAHVTVALSGDGGDELFGGYVRHIVGPPLWRGLRVLPKVARRRIAGAISHRPPSEWDDLFTRLRPLVPAVRIPGIRMHKLAAALDADSAIQMHEALASHWRPADGLLAEATAVHREATSLGDARSDFMLADLQQYLPDDVLTKVDRASMAVSLEAREPLLDHRLVEFAWRLPTSMKIRGKTGKWLLRKVLERHVPLDLLSGPKMGFAIPLGDWLRGPLRPWAEELLRPAKLAAEGLFNPRVVHQRWSELLAGTHPWEYHVWDVLMFRAWKEAFNS